MVKAINESRNKTKYLFMYISFSDTCYITKIKITVYGLSKLLLLELLSKSLNKANEMRLEIHLKVLCEMLQIVYIFSTPWVFFPQNISYQIVNFTHLMYLYYKVVHIKTYFRLHLNPRINNPNNKNSKVDENVSSFLLIFMFTVIFMFRFHMKNLVKHLMTSIFDD